MVDLPEPERPVNHRTRASGPSARRAALTDVERLPVDIGRAAQAELDHARADRGVGERGR